MGMLQVWIFESLPFQTASHYAPYITDTVCVCPWLHLLNQLTDLRLKKFTHMKVTSTL